ASPAEVTEKHRVTPVYHARDDDVINVAENFLKRLAFLGRALRELLANSAGLVVRRNPQAFEVFAKIGNPVREFMQLFTEFVRRRVTERLLLPVFHRVSFINTPL